MPRLHTVQYLEGIVQVLPAEHKSEVLVYHCRVELTAKYGVYAFVDLLVKTFHLEKEEGEDGRR